MIFLFVILNQVIKRIEESIESIISQFYHSARANLIAWYIFAIFDKNAADLFKKILKKYYLL